jgi:hypothetical protein
MIKNIISVIFNLFNFDRPRFAQLRYTDVVINNKAYFLVSWKIEGGYKFKIKSLNYRSYKSSGSAYIAIPDDINAIELVISNLWKSDTKKIALLRQSISSQLDFFPVKQFKELTTRSIYMPQLSVPINNLQIPVFAIHTKNLTKP